MRLALTRLEGMEPFLTASNAVVRLIPKISAISSTVYVGHSPLLNLATPDLSGFAPESLLGLFMLSWYTLTR